MATLEELKERGAHFKIKVFKRPYGNDSAPRIEGEAVEESLSDKYRKELSFDLEVLQVHENVMVVKSIHVDGSLIVFDEAKDKVQTDLWALMDNRSPLVYQDVVIDRGYDYNEKISSYMIIRPISACASMNKRNAFRVSVGLNCQVQLHSHGGVVPAMLKDISMSGFGIELSNEIVSEAVPKQDTISVEFTDVSISPAVMRFSGVCVRKMDGDKTTVYGCMCTTPTKEFRTYVMAKQAQKAHA